jgi:Carboxypeptidase regulatory-like domain
MSHMKLLVASPKCEVKTGMLAAALVCLLLTMAGVASAQRDKEEPTAILSFLVIKDDNGKPIRNAAVIMHPVEANGKQSRGDLELKTDVDGKTSFDGVPYGRLRVQVLASGFQTFGEDYDIAKAKLNFTIKLKRPQSQYSIYESHNGTTEEKTQEKKDDKTPAPADPSAKPQ